MLTVDEAVSGWLEVKLALPWIDPSHGIAI
jgi:hypothetical protein